MGFSFHHGLNNLLAPPVRYPRCNRASGIPLSELEKAKRGSSTPDCSPELPTSLWQTHQNQNLGVFSGWSMVWWLPSRSKGSKEGRRPSPSKERGIKGVRLINNPLPLTKGKRGDASRGLVCSPNGNPALWQSEHTKTRRETKSSQ